MSPDDPTRTVFTTTRPSVSVTKTPSDTVITLTTLNYIRTTTTRTGLQVQAHLLNRVYDKGVKITDAQMRTINLARHPLLPKWNYTVSPA